MAALSGRGPPQEIYCHKQDHVVGDPVKWWKIRVNVYIVGQMQTCTVTVAKCVTV